MSAIERAVNILPKLREVRGTVTRRSLRLVNDGDGDGDRTDPGYYDRDYGDAQQQHNDFESGPRDEMLESWRNEIRDRAYDRGDWGKYTGGYNGA